MERVIFSIDDWSNLRKLARFLRHMADCQALGKLKGEFKVLQGCYNGIPEISFMCLEEDFSTWVEPYGWTDNQESVLLVMPNNDAILAIKHGHPIGLGKWTNVAESEKGGSWTYDPKDNSWWTCI